MLPTMTTPQSPRYALLPTAAHREVAGEIFVITGDRGFHRLESTTAVAVFRLLAGAPRSVEELAAAITATHQIDLATATDDIAEFIGTMIERHIAQAVQPATFAVPNS